MSADFLEHRAIDVADTNSAITEMAKPMREQGATWFRVTLVAPSDSGKTEGPQTAIVVLQGWKIRPEDEEPVPTL